MKTKDEMENVPSFDELVFENRNKEYGAYQIRKRYNTALIWSILVSVIFISATVVTPYVIYSEPPIIKDTLIGSTTIAFDPDIKLPVQEIEKPKSVAVNIKPLIYKAPVVVDTLSPEQDKSFLTNDEVNANVKDEKVADIIPTGVVNNEIIDVDNKAIVDIGIITEKPFFGTEGDNEFRRWIAQNVHYPQALLEAGIQGKVYLQFVIEKDGSITNVQVLRSVDPLLDKEAVRVLESSPKWNPGKQQGNTVRVRYTFPIAFVINDLN
ncbi:MAG: energy transducer TonB [Bacteroidales bacterium]|nr:energy transducer TonB [Bacteroidales bacterium]